MVDGYNVIRAYERYRLLIDEDLDDGMFHDVYMRARKALVADVASFAQGSYDATVVFDGFGNLSPERSPLRVAGVDVVFSPTGVEADTVIERIVSQERATGREVTVVTSDSVVQNTVFGGGVSRMSARMFAEEAGAMNASFAVLRQIPVFPEVTKATVEDRIDPSVRERLRQMTLPRRVRDQEDI